MIAKVKEAKTHQELFLASPLFVEGHSLFMFLEIFPFGSLEIEPGV